jgi:hypothetical protein
MKVRRGMAKLLCFKGIVFIRFVQTWIFSILLEKHVFSLGKTFSYNDVLYGIPGVLTCVEMVLFSALFWYAFSSTEYGSGVHKETPLPLWKAVLHALNPWDIIEGMYKIFPLSIEMSRDGEWAKWRVAMKERSLLRKGIKAMQKKKGQGRYQELDEGRESYSRPMEMQPGARDSYQEGSYYQMSGAMGQSMYQPPAGSPPDEASTGLMAGKPSMEYPPGEYPSDPPPSYLGANTATYGRPRASSQSALMAESSEMPGRARSPSMGQPRYDHSRSPSGRFVEEQMQGRDVV